MKAKGVVLPLEYTENATATISGKQSTAKQNKTKRKVSFDTAKQSARVNAVTVTKAKRRPDRRSRLTMQQGDSQHEWVQLMLRQRGLPVRGDAMLDHGRLLHNLIYDTSSAPSGAMMDENYVNIRRSMGGPDTANMVPQMQTFVCRQERDSEQQQLSTNTKWENNAQQPQLPTAPPWDEAAESELWNEMWDEDADRALAQVSDGQEAAASARDSNNDAPMPTTADLQAWENESTEKQPEDEHNAMIQCMVAPPAHTTSTAVRGLALIGGAATTAALAVVAVICWLSLHGIHVTGFWLTLTPTDRDTGAGGDDNALK